MGKKKENKDIDSKEKALDYAIRDFEKWSESKYGYKIKEKTKDRTYYNYMSNVEWKNYLSKMSSRHKAQYNDGDGGELKEKRGRYGLYPPKMASFGSSSHFIYERSRDIPDFVFEKQLPTRVGGIANLDGFLSKEKENIYVEAKCREIYGNHEKVEIKKVYEKVYNYIQEKKIGFNCVEQGKKSSKNDYAFYSFKYNNPIKHFDIKQLICHFLAIAADYLENKHTKKIKFLYLIFDPHEVEDNIDEKYKKKILGLYDETIKEINSIDKCKLFKAVWNYQKESLKYNNVEMPEFEFVLCAQDYKGEYRNDVKNYLTLL